MHPSFKQRLCTWLSPLMLGLIGTAALAQIRAQPQPPTPAPGTAGNPRLPLACTVQAEPEGGKGDSGKRGTTTSQLTSSPAIMGGARAVAAMTVDRRWVHFNYDFADLRNLVPQGFVKMALSSAQVQVIMAANPPRVPAAQSLASDGTTNFNATLPPSVARSATALEYFPMVMQQAEAPATPSATGPGYANTWTVRVTAHGVLSAQDPQQSGPYKVTADCALPVAHD